MNIMVVDDEKATESLFNQQFRDEIKKGQFSFTFALSAEEAVNKINASEDPSAILILSDINMPGMTGLQLLKELKTSRPNTPVMIVTAYGDEANHMKAMSYKADGFINKPIDFAALKNKILKFLPKQPSSTETSHTKKATKILVVDDEPALEALIKQKFKTQIRNNEMEFFFASNGLEALKLIDSDSEIGVVLTDINMPEMDGLTLLSKIREKNRLFKSIVISAYGDMENIRAAMNLGASDFITKPIDLKDLATTLENITSQYNSLMQGVNAQSRLIEYRKELEIAFNIQQTFMPNNTSPFPDKLEVFGKMFPAQEIGGDFFDFFQISKNQIGFVIADVSGKGVPAALFMVMSKTLLRSAALANPSPKECMMEVSHYLCYNNDSMMFVTAFYGILNVDTGEVHYCDAGHLPPYILSIDGTLKKIPKEGGIALGVIEGLEQANTLLSEKSLQLEKGDSLILFTDGLTESVNQNNDLYPVFRLENILKTNAKTDLPTLINDVKNDLNDFTEGTPPFDDVTVLCLRWKK